MKTVRSLAYPTLLRFQKQSVPQSRVGAKMPLPGLSGAAAERYGATPSSAGCPMPYRFNEPHCHKIPRARYRVQNWPEYDRALQRRGELTVWVTPEPIAAWCPPRTGRRGRSRDYSDVAIETGHLLRLAFGRPWRQTEGLLRSLTALLGLELGIPTTPRSHGAARAWCWPSRWHKRG